MDAFPHKGFSILCNDFLLCTHICYKPSSILIYTRYALNIILRMLIAWVHAFDAQIVYTYDILNQCICVSDSGFLVHLAILAIRSNSVRRICQSKRNRLELEDRPKTTGQSLAPKPHSPLPTPQTTFNEPTQINWTCRWHRINPISENINRTASIYYLLDVKKIPT